MGDMLDCRTTGDGEVRIVADRDVDVAGVVQRRDPLGETDLELLRAVLEALPHCALLVDEHHRIVTANQAVADVVGKPVRDLCHAFCPTAIHGVTGDYPGCPLGRARAQARGVERELFEPDRDRTVLSSIYPTGLRTRDGDRIFLHFAHDVSEERRAARALARQQRLERLLAEILVATVGPGDLGAKFQAVVRRLAASEDLPFDGRGALFIVAQGTRLLRLVSATCEPREALDAVVSCGCVQGLQVAAGRALQVDLGPGPEPLADEPGAGWDAGRWTCLGAWGDGELLGAAPLGLRPGRGFDDQGRRLLEAVRAVFSVVMARVREADLLEQSEARFRTIAGMASDPIVLYDDLLRVRWWNEAARQEFGGEVEEVDGSDVAELLGLSGDAVLDWLRAAVSPDPGLPEGPVNYPGDGLPRAGLLPLRLVGPDGGRRHVEASLARAFLRGEPRGILVLRDRTDLERLRARLAHTDRLASVGTLAAGCAHGVNNPLTVVIGNIEFARGMLSDLAAYLPALPAPVADALGELAEMLGEAQDGAGQVGEIVRNLKGFTQDDRAPATLLDPGEVVRMAVRLVESGTPHRATITLDMAPTPAVVARASRLKQVMVNLLINAFQAALDEAHRVAVSVRAEAGDVLVAVRDTGEGIPAEHLKSLFDPFFTTRPPGSGTGLGLWICHNYVEEMGGRIEVDSAPGQGTTFTVRLPAADSPFPR